VSANDLAQRLGDACYVFLALNFLWGLYCVMLAWMRVRKLSFRSHKDQDEYMRTVMAQLRAGQYQEAEDESAKDPKALPQLVNVAISNRDIGYDPMRQVVSEVLQRDILGDLDRITGWVATVIKSGPLLGLFGTVLGMMAAFGRIGTGDKVKTSQIADEISIALICTAMGLATAIPFNYLLNNLNSRIGKLRDSLTAGLVRVLDHFKKRPAGRREREHVSA
jgi:biopolymer transport protein ExbB